MTIVVQDNWEQDFLSDGTPIKSVRVMDGDRMVGRVVDIKQTIFAQVVGADGEIASVMLPDYLTAVGYIADYVRERAKRLH